MVKKQEELPLFESFGRSSYSYKKYNKYHFTKDRIRIGKFIDRVLKNNIGKSYAMAYHFFCKNVEPQYRFNWDREFSSFRRNWKSDYYIDNDGLIQTNKEFNPRQYIVYSWDYKEETYYYVRIWSGASPKWITQKEYVYSKHYHTGKTKIVITGTKTIYPSRSKVFRKHFKQEEIKRIANRPKINIQPKTHNIASSNHSSRDKKKLKNVMRAIERNKQVEENKQIMERLGFDYKTSFRNFKN